MLLKTSCKDCKFATEPGCQISRPIFFENENQRAYGLCSFKRPKTWDKSIKEIDKENSSLSVVIISEDGDPYCFVRTLSDLKGVKQITQIVAIAQCKGNNKPKAIADNLMGFGVGWRYIDWKDPETFLTPQLLWAATSDVDQLWFLPIISGNSVDTAFFKRFELEATNEYNSLVTMYLNKLDDFSKIISTEAYRSMEGDYEEPWVDKLKRFENWEYTCKKIR